MNGEEKLQQKKDKLWEMHEADSTIACIESKARSAIEGMRKAVAAWDAARLSAAGNNLVYTKSEGSIPEKAKAFPGSPELAAIMQELKDARENRSLLQREFDRMRT